MLTLIMDRDLEGLFNPKSIAVVGASESPLKVGAIALKNIILSGFKGKLYPVNPNINEFGGLKFFRSVSDLPETPDLVVVAIPAKLVNDLLRECGEKGVKNIVIYSAGYKETGDDGKKMEDELVEIANKYALNILGPNCMGYANTNPNLNVTFGQSSIDNGRLKLISQSGSLAASLFDWCSTTKLGFDSFVTVGNKSVINENDVMMYWSKELIDKEVNITPVGMYLESIVDGHQFLNIVKQITPLHPVFILKPGRSANAAKAMQSHTGAIAGEDKVFDTAMKQAGVIRCQEMNDFFDLSQAVSWGGIPSGPKVAVVTNAGGPAVMVSDSISKYGLQLAQLNETSTAKLHELLPKMASIKNPIDVLGDALEDRFAQSLEVVINDENVDSVLVVLTPQLMTQVEKTAVAIGLMAAKSKKPIYCSFVGGEKVEIGRKTLNEYKITNFDFPEQAVKTLSTIWEWEKWRRDLGLETTENSLESTNKVDSEILRDKDKLMTAMKIAIPATANVTSIEEAKQFAVVNEWPVVLKIVSPDILHKAEIGGVKTNIANQLDLEMIYEEMRNTADELQKHHQKPINIEIQKQIIGGVEVILGAKRDPVFGTVLLFGAGGKYAEILDDHSLTVWPARESTIKEMVENSKVYKFLAGFRDDPEYNLQKLYEAIRALGDLMESNHQITEMEINPLIISHNQTWAVDVKIVI